MRAATTPGQRKAGIGLDPGQAAAGISVSTPSRIERDPVPLGWRCGGETRLRPDTGQDSPAGHRYRCVPSLYVAAHDTAVWACVSVRTKQFLADQGWQPIYGVQAGWRPQRTHVLDSEAEHRFFGGNGMTSFQHRMPGWRGTSCAVALSTPHPVAVRLCRLPTMWRLCSMRCSLRGFPNPGRGPSRCRTSSPQQGLPAATSVASPIVVRRALSIVKTTSLDLAYRACAARWRDRVRDKDPRCLDTGLFATGSAATNNLQYGSTCGVCVAFDANSQLAAWASF